MRPAHALVLALASSSCERDSDSATPDDAASTSKTVDRTQVAPGERLLYLPDGDPESLLGREVSQDANGHTVIAAERKPGCTASVEKVDTAFARAYESELRNVAGFEATVKRMVELEGHYESGLRLRLSVDNAHVLRGELSGNCGEQVIAEVKVGTGSREVVQLKQGGGTVKVDAGLAGGGGVSGERSTTEAESLTWDTPQAWAFTLASGNVGRALVEIRMPESLVAGQRFTPSVTVNAPLWLVVLYRDAEGHHGVLAPRGGTTALRASGDTLELPTLVPENLPGHEEDREMLLVYGFTEAADFDLFKPPAGAIDTAQADAYATALKERLDAGEIPKKRWTSAEFTYVIQATSP